MTEYGQQLMNKWLDGNYEITQTPGKAHASTRKFYKNHQGWDYRTPEGTAVKSKLNGEVVFAGMDNAGWGNRVGVYDPQTGTTTYLSHLSDVRVKKGQKVTSGSILGLTGGSPGKYGSGNTTGSHLDITEYKGNKAYTPSFGSQSKKFNVNDYLKKYSTGVLNKIANARKSYGNKLVAFSTSKQKMEEYNKKRGGKGKVIRL